MWRIPLSDLSFDQCEKDAVHAVLDSRWLTMGPLTREFEKVFADRHGHEEAVAVANCTCALELVYRYILQSRPDRRTVIVPDITFVATANAVLSAGGTPLLCDVESGDVPFISCTGLEALLQNRPDVGAVVLVHYGGFDAGAERVAEICTRYDVHLVEDCAHSPAGRTASGKALGTIGLAGCFSFFSNKNLSTGEGGMILSSDAALLSWTAMARSHGVTSSTHTRHISQHTGYDVEFPGHNYRCTEITAALGLAQLDKLESSNARRRDLSALYGHLLAGVPGVNVVFKDATAISRSDCHIFPVLFESVELRQAAVDRLTEHSIQTSHHYPPIHAFSWYQEHPEFAPAPLANATEYAARELTLPLYPGLTDDQVSEICGVILGALS